MFDIQYANKFGQKSESMEELNSIFNGIKDKLVPGYAVIYEWAKQRDIFLHEKYGKKIDERTLTAKVKNKEANEEAKLLLYDPKFEEDKTLCTVNIDEIKVKRRRLVELTNELAITIIQFDNVIEEMASRIYNELFVDSASESLYKEGLVRIGFNAENIMSTLLSLRGLRNKFCHSYGFHKIFIEMSVGKIHYHRLSIYTMGKVGKRLFEMHNCIQDIKKGYLKRSFFENKDQINNKVKYWFYFPENAKIFR